MSGPPYPPYPPNPQYPQNPYLQHPVQYAQPHPGSYGQRPAVVSWFIAYCVLMALMYLLCAVGGAAILIAGPEALADSQTDGAEVAIQGWALLIVGLPLMFLFALAPMLPRRPGVWIYDIVLICLGLTSVCCLPATIPLLIYWLKPDTKVWFGRMP